MPDQFPSSEPSLPSVNRGEFLTLYARHSRQLYAYLRSAVPQQADADDAFQDLSAILWERFDRFEPGTNFLAWSMQVARYWLLNWRERTRRAPAPLDDELLESLAMESLAMQGSLEAQHEALADCYKRLTAAQRRLIDRRYQVGVRVQQLAEELNRPLRTVYRLLEQAHTSLLKCINGKLGGGPPQ